MCGDDDDGDDDVVVVVVVVADDDVVVAGFDDDVDDVRKQLSIRWIFLRIIGGTVYVKSTCCSSSCLQ